MNNNKKKKTIAVRREKEKRALLDLLRKTPIIQIACERSGVSRATYYRWRDEDEEFRSRSESALREGEALVTDMSEAQVISLIKEKNWSAISFWLKHHHPKYATRLEVVARTTVEEKLNPEQEALLHRALKFSLSGEGKTRRTRRTIEVKVRKHGDATA